MYMCVTCKYFSYVDGELIVKCYLFIANCTMICEVAEKLVGWSSGCV